MLSKVKRLNFHRRKTDRLRPGFGVEFLGVDTDARNRLRAALRGLPPPIPCKRRAMPVPKFPHLIAPVRPSIVVPKPTWDTAAPRNIPVPRPSWDYPIY